MDWDSVTWEEFASTLQNYRAKYFEGSTAEEKPYLQISRLLADTPADKHHTVTLGIVNFLNSWHCRFSKDNATIAISDWIQEHYVDLAIYDHLQIIDDDALRVTQDAGTLYQTLIDLKSEGPNTIPNMSDAAASKILHMLRPRYFVMWDSNIITWTGRSYPTFLMRMHRFANHLKAIAPDEAGGEVEEYLNKLLHYPQRKSLAKYIDEFNWYLAFGNQRV